MMPAYQLRHLQFFYGDKQALDIAQLEIHSQRITALMGENGSGKSTLLNLLALLAQPTHGEIRYFGKPERNSAAPTIALLPQKPYLFHGSVEDNLRLALTFKHIPRSLHKKMILQALERLQITALRQQSAKALSGGQVQKVALARAIITEPRILLMDEPFSYLDQHSIKAFEQFIRDYQQEYDATIVFSTHDRLQGMALADDVISLMAGRPVSVPLVNVFHGIQEKQCFNTGKIHIYLPDNCGKGKHVAIDPKDIVLSRQALVSSMRNQFAGRITAMGEEHGNVRVTIDAKETFQALITHHAMHALGLKISDEIWVNFKSNSVVLF